MLLKDWLHKRQPGLPYIYSREVFMNEHRGASPNIELVRSIGAISLAHTKETPTFRTMGPFAKACEMTELIV